MLQLGIANAAGAELEALAFASTVFEAIDVKPDRGTLAHPGALPEPVETIDCPLVEPEGLRSWTGVRVVATLSVEKRNAQRPKIFFI